MISTIVNRFIDYGADYNVYDKKELICIDKEDSTLLRQLKYFYQKDLEKKYSKEKSYVKAYYLHHLLDYFRETRFDINNIELVFEKFLEEKAVIEFSNKNGYVLNFKNEINDIFQQLRDNQQELINDLKGNYLINLENNEENNKNIG